MGRSDTEASRSVKRRNAFEQLEKTWQAKARAELKNLHNHSQEKKLMEEAQRMMRQRERRDHSSAPAIVPNREADELAESMEHLRFAIEKEIEKHAQDHSQNVNGRRPN